MTIRKIQDKYNDRKTWYIKRYADGHYYINQAICGKLFYGAYQRTTKKFISDIFK